MRVIAILNIISIILWNSLLNAQINPTPASVQSKPIVLWGATIHTGKGQIVTKGYLRFDKGKISKISDASLIKKDTITDTIIDVSGKQIYPGLIALNTQLGLNEIDAARPTIDKQETGDINPNARTIIAYNTDSKITPTVRSNGILLAEIAPTGGLISGTSSMVQLDAWNWEDAVYKMDYAIHLHWPTVYSNQGWWAEPGIIQKTNNDKKYQQLKNLFDDLMAYQTSTKARKIENRNLVLESMLGLMDGTKKLFVHADFVKDIISAINFFKEYNILPVIVGGADSWMCTDILKQNSISVILETTHRLPLRDEDDVAQPYKTPAMLKNAGILFAISYKNAWEQRSLAFNAGTAATYGLSKEEALQSITLNPAKIYGIDSSTGSIETGKDATLIVSEGDIMDMKESNVIFAFIKGRRIDLKNQQTLLYEKYKNKYGK